jgi:hypothetical protein
MKLRFKLALLASAVTIGASAGATSAAPHATGAAGARVFTAYVAAPAQFDLSLAEISFGAAARIANAGGPRRYRSALRIALRGTAGLNYLVGAVTRFNVRRRPRVLVLVVNRRPRGSLAPDIARVGLRVTAARRLGAPRLLLLTNPFSRPTGLTPALCDLPIRGPTLTAGDLRAVLGRGRALGGFAPAAAVAQAYDAVCGRPYSPAFRQAVTLGAGSSCEAGQAIVAGCCPPNAMCVAPPPPPQPPPQPCPPCPCRRVPCPLAGPPGAGTAIACLPQSRPIACPL